MRQTTGTRKSPGEKLVKDIKRATRKQYSSEEKISKVRCFIIISWLHKYHTQNDISCSDPQIVFTPHRSSWCSQPQ